MMRIRLSVLVTSAVLALAAVSVPSAASAALPTCFGRAATIVGTDGDDRIVGTSGSDVIVALDGAPVVRVDDLHRLMAEELIETPVTVTIVREGRLLDLRLVPVELEL